MIYQKLYNEYYSALVVYAISFVSQKVVAEDIVEDLFIHIWENEIKIEFNAQFRIFLYNSVKNRSLNHIKHLDVEEKYINFVIDNQEAPPDLDQEIEEQDIYRQLSLAIEDLPARCREVFELHLNGKRNDEIAKLLNISVETVKTQKKRAVKQLKEKMNPFLFIMILPFILH
jgi:RNA polymerase sigma-70 factor (ECF subfamily)